VNVFATMSTSLLKCYARAAIYLLICSRTRSGTRSDSTQSTFSAMISWKTKIWLIDCTADETRMHFKHKN